MRPLSLPRRARRGFTLVELLIVIILLGIVGSAITTVVVRQQRFYRGANEILDTRGQIRQAAAILPTELRGMSSAGGDLRAIGPQTLEFNAPIGTSIACQLLNGGAGTATQVALPPVAVNGPAITSFLSTPAAGDLAFVYNDNGTVDNLGDDSWTTTSISTAAGSVTSVNGINCIAPAAAYTVAADNTQPRLKITFASAPPNMSVGTVIRFARPVRYSLYRASDNRWYLGYEQLVTGPTGAAWTGVQPVSGPYLAGDAGSVGDRGLQFRYFLQSGAEVTALPPTTTPIARVDIVVRGETRQPVQLSGTAPTRLFRDSLNLSVAIRNSR